jgi:DNA-directed RNA polymerase specialized sigma24 family protein
MRESQYFARAACSHNFEAIYRAASRLAMRPEDAEDLAQEVCVKAFVRLSDLESIEHRQTPPRSSSLQIFGMVTSVVSVQSARNRLVDS